MIRERFSGEAPALSGSLECDAQVFAQRDRAGLRDRHGASSSSPSDPSGLEKEAAQRAPKGTGDVRPILRPIGAGEDQRSPGAAEFDDVDSHV